MAYQTANIFDADFETTSEVDLLEVGAHRYSRDPSTVCYQAWFHIEGVDYEWRLGWPLPIAVMDAINRGMHLAAHNREFEACIWNNLMHPRYGWPKVPIDSGICTAAVASYNGMPRTLEAVANVRGYKTQKDMVGAAIMKKMLKGYDIPLATGFTIKDAIGNPILKTKKGDNLWRNPDIMNRISAYCHTDIHTEREILKDEWMHPLPPSEYRIWQADQRINWRGAYLNRPVLAGCIETYERLMLRLNNMLCVHTSGRVPTAGSDKQVVAEAKYYGYNMQGNNKESRADILNDKNAPDDLKKLVHILSALKKTSCSKFYAMRNAVCDDGRVRGLMVYYGAMRTGRWAAKLIQLQNLTGNADLTDAIYEFIMDCAMRRDVDSLIAVFGWQAMDALSWCIRPLICAAPGKELVDADYSAIEARVLAWGAGETWRLEFFRYTPDTWPESKQLYHEQLAAGTISKGQWPMKDGSRFKPDIYVKSYSEAYSVPYQQVTKKMRKVGKIQELALGYMGGEGAMMNFGADKLGMSSQDMNDAKNKWRNANPNIKRFWYDMEKACIEAIENPGYKYWVGDKAAFFVNGPYLHMQLPSGRLLFYYMPSVKEEYNADWDKWQKKIYYWGRKSDEGGKDESRKWTQLDTYGGKLVENWTQAVSRDITANAVVILDANGYDTIFHVHDEVVDEEDEGKVDVKEFCDILCDLPSWAATLPVNAAGWKGQYFKKD